MKQNISYSSLIPHPSSLMKITATIITFNEAENIRAACNRRPALYQRGAVGVWLPHRAPHLLHGTLDSRRRLVSRLSPAPLQQDARAMAGSIHTRVSEDGRRRAGLYAQRRPPSLHCARRRPPSSHDRRTLRAVGRTPDVRERMPHLALQNRHRRNERVYTQ